MKTCTCWERILFGACTLVMLIASIFKGSLELLTDDAMEADEDDELDSNLSWLECIREGVKGDLAAGNILELPGVRELLTGMNVWWLYSLIVRFAKLI